MIRELILIALVATAAHAERPADYASGVALVPAGSMPFQRVAVPATVYERAVRSDVADLRVFNADAEVVPYAWLPRAADARARAEAIALPLFPLYVDRDRRDVSGLVLHVIRNAAGTAVDIRSDDGAPDAASERRLAGLVLDASALAEALNALVFTLPASVSAQTMHLRVDASDDLASWRTVTTDAVLVDLEYEGRRLVRDRVEIPPTRAKYLRLMWTPGQPVIDFTGVSGEAATRIVEAPRQWRTAPGTPVPDREGEFEYDLGGAFPVDRIDVGLAQPNSVVPAQFLARASPAEPWQNVASSVFYRLREPDGEVTSAPVPVIGAARRYWLLRLDARSGVRTAPPLRAGWQPAEIVFANRGVPPFTLAYGNYTASPGALPIATLVPGYDAEKGLPANVGTAAIGPAMELGGPDRLRAPPDVKRWILWASLVLGALVLGWMAWRLSREMGAAPASRDTGTPPD